jgi:hypothetical protein
MRRLDSPSDPLEYAQLVAAHSIATQALRQSQPTPPPPLAHDWEGFLYTDGSHVKAPDIEGPGIEAAVHVPGPSSHTLAVHCAWQGEGADITCNTICRADWAALHVAITQYGTTHIRGDGKLHVATDSLGSMHRLAKMITRPQDQKEHRHRQVLEALASAVKDHPCTIHLWKVNSHTGIIGNDGAVQVGRRELPDTQVLHTYDSWAPSYGMIHWDWVYDTPSNSRRQMYWPYKETSKGRPSGEIVKVTTPLPDMQEALKHEAHTCAKLGSATRDGIYASSWMNVADKLHHPASHAFMNSSKVGRHNQKLVLQYRWGLLPTNRLLHRSGKVPTNHCPLCGEEDRGHHAISGCRELSAAYTRRHNDVGTEILEAISRGKEAGTVFLSEVGYTKRKAPSEVPEGMQPHRFMRHMDPPSCFSHDLPRARCVEHGCCCATPLCMPGFICCTWP